MEEIKLEEYQEEISSQKDKKNSKEVRQVLNAAANYDARKVNTNSGMYSQDTSIYFVPMYKSQYVLVCVSDEPIDVSQLENCESKDEIVEIGKTMSPSFRSVSGGKVKANDPLLNTVHAYVSGENKDQEVQQLVDDMLKSACSQHNELVSLMKQEETEYRDKVDVLQEIQFNISLTVQAMDKKDLETLEAQEKEYDKVVEQTIQEKNKFIEKSKEVLETINAKYAKGLEKIKEKYGQEYDTSLEDKNIIVRCPINKNMCLVCEANPNVDLSKINEVKSSEEAKAIGLAPKGAVIYGNNDPKRPTESDIYVKYNAELDSYINESSKVMTAFDVKYETSMNDIERKLKEAYTKKEIARKKVNDNFKTSTVTGIEDVQSDEQTIQGKSREELLELYDQTVDLTHRLEKNHSNIMNHYLDTATKLNELVMAGEVSDNMIKNTSKFAHEANSINGEIKDIITSVESSMELTNTVTEFAPSTYEVDAEDLVMSDGKIVTDDEYQEKLNEKIEKMKEYSTPAEIAENIGVPIREGDTIVGFIDPIDPTKPKEEVVDPHADEVKITLNDGTVEYVKQFDAKESLESLKKAVESNTPEVTYEDELNSKTK